MLVPHKPSKGDLFDQGDLTYTVPAEVGDYGKGTLIWRKLNARSFGFVIDNPRGWATAVDGFAVSAATAGEDAIADDRRVDAPDFEACKLLYRRHQALPSDDAGSAPGRAP